MFDLSVVLAALCASLALSMGALAWGTPPRHHLQRQLFGWLGIGACVVGGFSAATINWAVFEETAVAEVAAAPLAPFYGQPAAAPALVAETAAVMAPTTAAPITAARLAAPQAVIAEPADAPAPARLMIPTIGLDQPILVVPIVDGHWDLTTLGDGVGWLPTTGEHPEDDLAMVLVGHISVTAVERGAFAQLQRLKVGETVTYRAAGVDYVYAIAERTRVAPDDVQKLYVPGGNTLLLLTCTDWDFTRRTYENRLLVRATLVSASNPPSAQD